MEKVNGKFSKMLKALYVKTDNLHKKKGFSVGETADAQKRIRCCRFVRSQDDADQTRGTFVDDPAETGAELDLNIVGSAQKLGV